ncbi:TonB-dependent receptor [Segetibacter sp. 3557_3]|uniref:SusC/RagA family TonB-linked outer membrane protein n=1 Tax=Segetibacter sp. 3557_3 TaxID=2547429 RepID=UPI00105919DA|nr:TonB-dependent receptor [Segetibacter sp. 3557_3]TDH19990.1 TonB-dependent receptor [Segetibacter sp. 3557_3]
MKKRLATAIRWQSNLWMLLLFLLVNLVAGAQGTQDVKGTVADSKGQPAIGVTIAVKGATTKSVTDQNGAFTIKAAPSATLVLSAVNFQSKEVTVSGDQPLSIVLSERVSQLNEVVVVGYGRSNRRNLSSAVTSLKPEDLNRGAIADVGQLLQGKVAGVNVSASGDPNRPAAVILRGASTINSPQGPFYVIDGVPGADIATVAPDDIASMDVLKDASATAIYGNRAANGVIMITTKKGRKGQVQTNYSGYVGIEKESNRLDLMDAAQIRAYLAANGSAFSPNDDKNADTDWQSAIQRSQAISHNHNLSFTGGTEHSTYSASINYFDKEGILLKSRLKRIIARLNIEQYALNDKVKFGLNVANSNSNSNYVPLQNIVLLQAAKHLPVSPVLNPDGSYFENLNTTGYFNPLAITNNAEDDTKYNSLIGAFTTEVKLPFNLTYNANVAYQKTSTLHGEFYGSYYGQYPTSNFYNNPDPGIGIGHTLIGNLFGRNGSAIRNTFQNTTTTLESFLTWNKKLGEHTINAVVGYSWQDNTNGEGFQTSSTNFPTDALGYSNLTLGNPYALTSYRVNFGEDLTYQKIRLISDFARLNYNYKDKYLLQASLRRDGSSVFGSNYQWGYFPSASIAWRITQEDFMANQNIFSDLKLRASYGVTGNSGGIGAYSSKLIYGIAGTYYNNGVQENAYGPIQGSNPDLRWEKISTTNLGLDFTILKGKLSGSVDWYNKETTDMLFTYTVSSALVPGGRIIANGGSISNKGVELSLNATPVTNKDFTWTSSLNLAHNKNRITSLQGPYSNSDSIRYTSPEGPGQTGASLQLLKVGYPLGQFFTLQYAGKDENGISQFYKKDGSKTTGSGNPLIGADYFYMGDAQPKLLAGWSNTFRYKKLDLNVFARAVFGNKIFNATRADLAFVSAATANNLLVTAADDNIKDTKNSFYSNRYIENGDYVRLDNATLGYNFKEPIKYVNNIRLYVTGNNIFTITKYTGIDPEINQGGAAPGIDYNNFYPKTRTFMFGVNVSF